MDELPRSSKRRKLDAPRGDTTSPLVKSTLRKTSTRLTNRNTAENGTEVPEPEINTSTPTRKVQRTGRVSNASRNDANTTRSAKTPRNDGDVYDDIEGALPSHTESRESTPATKPRASARRKGSQPSAVRETPARSSRKKADPKTTNEQDLLAVDGNIHEVEVEADIQDELAEDIPPSPKRTRKPRATKASEVDDSEVQKKTPGRATGRTTRKKQGTKEGGLDEEELGNNDKTRAMPSRSRATTKVAAGRRSQRPSATTEDDEHTPTIPESESNMDEQDPPHKSTTPKERRRANRADHINNQDDATNTDENLLEDEMDVDGASVVGSVLDPTEPSPFNRPSPATKPIPQSKDISALLHLDHFSSREMSLLKSICLERITGKRSAPLIGLEEEYKTVHQLIEQTVAAGEGNSMLLIGARGSGKTTLVNKVLSEVSKDNSQDYHVVRLNGFIHTDDKIALREIWRQLGKEMDIEEDGGLGKNYADTLTTLLALLSHPSEQTGEFTDQVAKAVIFVMDEFDLFASHPRQTLLYNLFDIAQSRKAPIAVLGLTTRIDVANSLEKRVKSRFSHRYVHLSLAKSFTAFSEICKASLLVQPDQLTIEERAILSSTPSKSARKPTKQAAKSNILTEWNTSISVSPTLPPDPSTKPPEQHTEQHPQTLFASKSFLTSHLAPHYYRTKSVPSVLTSFLLPTATLSEQSSALNPTTALLPPDSKLALIPHLPTLALALIIAAARLDIIHDSDTCNFNMAYDEYVTLASKARIQSAAGGASASGVVSKVWGKEVARREWEALIELGLVMPVVSGMTGGFGMVKCDVALEEIGAVLQGEKGVDKALERWCRQI
ncbi:hypothetical protein BU24DRAFT_439522 [Aaosphaeria arxii CBS 175.79]|uniref:Origin recognition complex subunit 4 n=1 Tax=Aaosphaeria arxii CBS 175.79 TaxID=1450172 RepID=A0A6A5Y255_9PLEO|nr:uncharacterized protein BU24DRAFT_439522 [Aaosphaeria arxii CBS 175.79]KAF2019336.1 hypothetical protein BU24DRAFT_439522 [Aaosphaeria arxii CBS 175.79]